MNHSDVIVLLARQRSGTNPLRSVLGSHPDIFCFNEVFNFADKDSENRLLREPNFFTFLEKYAGGDIRRTLPDRHEGLFLDFLEYLRCFSPKRYLLIDVKYNSTHFLTKPWADDMTSPYLLDLIESYGLKVFNLTRRHYLRVVLSVAKAWNSGRYTVTAADSAYTDHSRRVDVNFLLGELDRFYAEDHFVKKRFASYPHLLSYDYAQIFPGGAAEPGSTDPRGPDDPPGAPRPLPGRAPAAAGGLHPAGALRVPAPCPGISPGLQHGNAPGTSRRPPGDHADRWIQAEISAAFLAQFSRWLGVPNTFLAASEYRKQSYLPLHETIENFDEIAQALRGTRYEYCLDDEPGYRRDGIAAGVTA